MNKKLNAELMVLAKNHVDSLDVAHDFSHSLRVLNNVLKINEKECVDEDVLIASALFHDLVNLPKGKLYSKHSAKLSAIHALELLDTTSFPKDKLSCVKTCIEEHSSSWGGKPSSRESEVLQDADRLDATGAVTVMRVSASSALMNRALCSLNSPSSLDFIEQKLLKAKFNTVTGTELGLPRIEYLRAFISQVKSELI